MQRRALCLLMNPGARSGRVVSRVRRLLSPWPRLRERVEEAIVRTDADVASAVRVMADDAVPVAVGGDGTVNMVVRGLRTAGLEGRRIGVLPLGTGNAFAHSVGLTSPRRALLALAGGRTLAVDVMTTTHRRAALALVSISSGFEAALIADIARRRRLGPLVAAAAGMARSIGGRWRGLVMTIDGAAATDGNETYYNAGLYNHRCYAMGRVVHPTADPCDGRGEAVVWRSARRYWAALARGVEAGKEAAAGTDGDPVTRRWARATIESEGDIQVDGEACGPAGSFEVRIETRALRVLVP